MKSGMRDKTVSRSVRTLQILSAIVGVMLVIMACMENLNFLKMIAVQYTVLSSNLDEVTKMFDLTARVFSRFYNILELPSYVLIIQCIAEYPGYA